MMKKQNARQTLRTFKNLSVLTTKQMQSLTGGRGNAAIIVDWQAGGG